MNHQKKILSSIVLLSLALSACSPKSHGPKNSLVSSLLAGIEGADTLDEKTAKKVRLRVVDGQKVLEYLDPGSTTEEKWVTYGKMKIISKGTHLHHWGPVDDVRNWASQGIRPEDIDNSVRNYDATDLVGGGFYASLSPVDSADYGTNQLVIEPKHDLIVLDLSGFGANYDRDRKALLDNSTQIYIFVPMLADAGIETIQYTNTWMVCISGKVVENLYEGSWDSFLSPSSTYKMDFVSAAKFAARYPLTPEVAAKPGFKEKLPVISRALNKEKIEESNLKEIAQSLIDNSDILLNMSNLRTPDGKPALEAEPWKDLYTQMKPMLFSLLKSKMDEYLTQKNFNMVEYNFAYVLKGLGYTFRDLIPDAPIYLDPQLSNNSTMSSGITWKSMDQNLFSNMSFLSVYEVLSRVQKGAQTAADIFGYAQGDKSPVEKIQLAPMSIDFTDPISAFKASLAAWTNQELTIRSKPQLVTGDVFLDGPNQPGYILVTASQKTDLMQNPYIVPTFKEVTGSDGQKEIYVRYESPSAQNYKKFADLLKDPALVQRLDEASKKGDLSSPDSEVSQQLTREVLTAILKDVLQNYYSSGSAMVCYLMKIQPFADPELNRLAVLSFSYRRSYRMYYFLDPNWAKVATYLDLVQLASQSSDMQMVVYRTLVSSSNSTSKTIDLDKDIGIWEIAANRGGPHKDPATFVAKVKARFEKDDVQQWLKDKQYGRILQALHEAGAD